MKKKKKRKRLIKQPSKISEYGSGSDFQGSDVGFVLRKERSLIMYRICHNLCISKSNAIASQIVLNNYTLIASLVK